jgi:acyl carrier protein
MTPQVVDELADTVAEVWAAELGVPAVRPDQGFFELGGHSLTALRTVHALRAKLGVQLSLRDLMEAATLADFTVTVRHSVSGDQPARPAVPLLGRRGTR